MTSTRKQVLISKENEKKLHELGKTLGLNNSQVVNLAIELLYTDFIVESNQKEKLILKTLLRKVKALEKDIEQTMKVIKKKE